ncbi:hypothetical protein IE53DRAFT_236513 [Violaceomyces palustris]|uniref:Uncharacterized protein n=1 Tax=Violaceomyces palustris TaxID=1673888 RepID=A0ACD0NPA7_9BASI|nr:hypothetical protein IE53DRAFT_236513 [Violaceomyces palustris]
MGEPNFHRGRNDRTTSSPPPPPPNPDAAGWQGRRNSMLGSLFNLQKQLETQFQGGFGGVVGLEGKASSLMTKLEEEKRPKPNVSGAPESPTVPHPPPPPPPTFGSFPIPNPASTKVASTNSLYGSLFGGGATTEWNGGWSRRFKEARQGASDMLREAERKLGNAVTVEELLGLPTQTRPSAKVGQQDASHPESSQLSPPPPPPPSSLKEKGVNEAREDAKKIERAGALGGGPEGEGGHRDARDSQLWKRLSVLHSQQAQADKGEQRQTATRYDMYGFGRVEHPDGTIHRVMMRRVERHGLFG